MTAISTEVAKHLENLSNKDGVISALAIDQRGSLKKMLAAAANKPADEETIVDFKVAVSSELTKYASAILLDPEYGLPAAKVRDANCGLLTAYEKTGYDATEPGRFPDLLTHWSARRLKEEGADAIKFLLYYDTDEDKDINDRKHAFVERVGAEAKEAGLPFFLELVSYDAKIEDVQSVEYAKVKPHKVLEMMKEFSKPEYNVTVLKMEVPFNIKYVEGYSDGEVVWTKDEAKKLFKEQSEATELPYIFLSAGVPAVSSCGREATEDYGDAIAFSASAEKVADSRSTGSVLVTTLNTDGSEIAVYGYHGGASDYSGKTPVFETDGAKRVYYRSSGNAGDTKWDYDYTGGADKVKWLRSDYYRFRAFYPYSLISKVNSSSNAEILALDYSLKEDDSDLMVAYTTRFPAGDGVGPVVLEFKHALSALQFVVKKENTSETEKIKEFYLTGLYQTGGLVYTSSDAANMTGEQTLNWIPSVSDENDPVHHWIAANETLPECARICHTGGYYGRKYIYF